MSKEGHYLVVRVTSDQRVEDREWMSHPRTCGCSFHKVVNVSDYVIFSSRATHAWDQFGGLFREELAFR